MSTNAVKPVSPDVARTSVQDPSLFINRELSWLAFNERVLALAWDEGHPLLERVKFLAIVGSNLDEFFMIRVAALHKQLRTDRDRISTDGLTTEQQLALVRARAMQMLENQVRCWTDVLRPALDAHGIRFLDGEGLLAGGRGIPLRVLRARDRSRADAARRSIPDTRSRTFPT